MDKLLQNGKKQISALKIHMVSVENKIYFSKKKLKQITSSFLLLFERSY